MATNVILNGRPLEKTWWRRNCNGKRYFLRNFLNTFGSERAVLFLEGTNRALHVPVKSVLKNYSPIDTTGMVTVQETSTHKSYGTTR